MAEEIRRTTHEILARANWREPLLIGAVITVTGVRISPDLKNCTLFVTPLGGEKEEEIVAALNLAKAYIRGELGHALNQLRVVPTLRFEIDRSFGEAQHIDALLRSRAVARDLEPGDLEPGEEGTD